MTEQMSRLRVGREVRAEATRNVLAEKPKLDLTDCTSLSDRVSARSPGDPAKGRVAIIAWESAEKAQAYRDSAAFKELLPIRDKLDGIPWFHR